MPGQQRNVANLQRCGRCHPQNTQIYEGTNQIQRVVMARQLLK
jgi:alkylation response protein AidB-like acyl-CoA dehydrogenase